MSATASAWPCAAERPKACARCGYALEVLPVAVLFAGHIELELRLCAHCRRLLRELLEP
jgi:hypothetical protein